MQVNSIVKLMGFKYKIVYKKGTKDKAADALSRRNASEGGKLCMVVSAVVPVWMQEIQQSYQGDKWFRPSYAT